MLNIYLWKKVANKTLLFLLVLAVPMTAPCDIYKYIGPDGRIYFTDEPEKFSKPLLVIRTHRCKPITKIQISAVEKSIKNKLTDPYSAHFKWSKNYCFIDEEIKYCAFVNAKNQFGGYVGYTPFQVTLTQTKKEWITKDIKLGEGVSCRSLDD